MTTHAAYQGEQQIQLPELVAAAQAGGMRGGTGTYIVGLPSVFFCGLRPDRAANIWYWAGMTRQASP